MQQATEEGATARMSLCLTMRATGMVSFRMCGSFVIMAVVENAKWQMPLRMATAADFVLRRITASRATDMV